MKIRTGFVSNSSSSSFIVISNSGKYERLAFPLEDGVLVVGENGTTEFGWDNIKYPSVYDRINFSFIQSDYGKDFNRCQMLEEVLRENIKGLTKIVWNISPDCSPKDGKVWGYIDHQSSRSEGQNMEMFETKETLKNFIFGQGSYIQGGNDNE